MTAAIENHRARLGAGEIYNGLWMMSTSPELAKIGSAAGFDYVCLDLQHGLVRPTAVLRLTDAVRASRPARGGGRPSGPTPELIHGAVQDTRDERPLLFVMIENAEGLAAVEDICAVPGIDGVYVGPSDLAFAVGALPGQLNDAHAEALVR